MNIELTLKDPKDVDFCFLDVETTGLDPDLGDRVCEIAIQKVRNGKIIESLETLVNPGRSIPTSATSIHKINYEMVMSSPYFRDIAEDIIGMLRNSVVVAHNASFDIKFIYTELRNLELPVPDFFVVDTLKIARRYFNYKNNSLGYIAKTIGFPTDNEHRAFGDVKIARFVFDYFLMELDRRGIRLNKLKDILKLQGKIPQFEENGKSTIPPDLEVALRERGKVQIKYLSVYSERESVRIIEPLDFNVSGKYIYILAYCHLRKERCKFRVDRILETRSVK